MDRFKKIYSHLVNESVRGDYEAGVDLSVTMEGKYVPPDDDIGHTLDMAGGIERNYAEEMEVISPKQVEIGFNIDIEYRSWGIKDIMVQPSGHGPIEVLLVDAETLDEYNPIKTLDLEIDFSQLKVDKNTADYISVGDLELVIDYNGNINYEKSYIDVHSI
jgi:hypothetical protein